MNTDATISLFEKYGGVPTVTSVVRNFFQRVLADTSLKVYFKAVDTERLIAHQITLIAYIMGKPASHFDLDRLTKAHTPLRISLASYERVVAILRQVLLDARVEGQDIITILNLLDAHRAKIVTSP